MQLPTDAQHRCTLCLDPTQPYEYAVYGHDDATQTAYFCIRCDFTGDPKQPDDRAKLDKK